MAGLKLGEKLKQESDAIIDALVYKSPEPCFGLVTVLAPVVRELARVREEKKKLLSPTGQLVRKGSN